VIKQQKKQVVEITSCPDNRLIRIGQVACPLFIMFIVLAMLVLRDSKVHLFISLLKVTTNNARTDHWICVKRDLLVGLLLCLAPSLIISSPISIISVEPRASDAPGDFVINSRLPMGTNVLRTPAADVDEPSFSLLLTYNI
jgi:hypothetical protein